MFLKNSYKQDITYWAPTGGDDGFGKKVLASPTAILGRWEDTQIQLVNAQGQQTISKAVIYTLDSEDLQIDGYLYLGTSTATDPRSISGAYPIIQVGRIPDLRNLEAVKTAVL